MLRAHQDRCSPNGNALGAAHIRTLVILRGNSPLLPEALQSDIPLHQAAKGNLPIDSLGTTGTFPLSGLGFWKALCLPTGKCHNPAPALPSEPLGECVWTCTTVIRA